MGGFRLIEKFANPPMEDRENGEVTNDKIVVLRKPPGSPTSSSNSSYYYQGIQQIKSRNQRPNSHILVRERNLSRGFRIHDALNRARQAKHHRSTFDMNMNMNYHQELMDYLYEKHYMSNPPFRVPSEALNTEMESCKQHDTNTLNICYWEEFLYGTNVLEKMHKPVSNIKYGSGIVPHNFFERYLPDYMVDIIVYFTFISISLLCLVQYNDFLELLCYIFLMRHLDIHAEAYKSNIDIVFGGSVFQGPGYPLVVNWCEHCQQRMRAKVVNNLMKKMKVDILERQKPISSRSI